MSVAFLGCILSSDFQIVRMLYVREQLCVDVTCVSDLQIVCILYVRIQHDTICTCHVCSCGGVYLVLL